ncbi:hypothetical protein NGM07_13960 [Halorussus vallis]|uniref:DUF7268 family protein n=1 Tax=Halorussus vallis TaxID=2953749 RepID=UPI00209FE6A0|nr:hypothetical protein [Halorussus vallis]USZ74544.1 hypothetical protein NGM07_13960 [Halorussus vallis]
MDDRRTESGDRPADGRPDWRRRARRVGRAAGLGFAAGALAVGGFVAAGETVRFASDTVFAVGALILGFAVLGWSGSVFAGRGIENAQEHLDVSSNWSEADSRRAMTLLAGVGVGGMVGSVLATLALGGV